MEGGREEGNQHGADPRRGRRGEKKYRNGKESYHPRCPGVRVRSKGCTEPSR